MFSLLKPRFETLFKGLALALVVAIAAAFLSEHYSAPAMLFALLIGMAFQFLSEDARCAPGIEFSSTTLLRLGVGLLGLRLSFGDVETIGLTPMVAMAGFVLATLGCGAILSYAFGRRLAFGLLAGGSVAICGASAALAIAAVLPPKYNREKDVLFVVIAVTTLSTIAMIAYPILFRSLGLSHLESGFLIGATIHDVAQVVGAGYSISDEAGVVATFIKMLRVALLPIVLMVVMVSFRGSQPQKMRLPWFLVMFVVLAVLANLNLIPQAVIDFVNILSRWLLIIAISALGIKTSLANIVQVGASYAAILVIETIFLLVIALLYIIKIGI